MKLVFQSLVPGQPEDPKVAKEIGPSGGVIELENVARLEIPAGALERPTFIEIHQVLEVESTLERCSDREISVHPLNIALPGDDFITPVIRLEPFGLELKIPAKLYLKTDAARVGKNDPKIIKYVGSKTAKNGDWKFRPYVNPATIATEPRIIQAPLFINVLVYYAKQFPVWIKSDMEAFHFMIQVNLEADSE